MNHSKNIFLSLLLTSLLLVGSGAFAQEKKAAFEGYRWRVGFSIQYATSFQNLRIQYSGLGYTGVLGGFTGRGAELFGGYKFHKYVAFELGAGLLLNSYNRSYDQGLYIIGRFNKFYITPSVKFIYPLINRDFGTVNVFLGGGVGLNGSGRFYLEENYYGSKDIRYARYDPMVAPFLATGVELLFSDRSNLIIGVKYQNGYFNANSYYDSLNPQANVKNADKSITTMSAQGIGIYLGFIQEF